MQSWTLFCWLGCTTNNPSSLTALKSLICTHPIPGLFGMQWTAKICMPQQDDWKWEKWTIVLMEKYVISVAGRSKLQYKEAGNEIRYLVLHWAEIKVAIHKAGLVLSFRLYYSKNLLKKFTRR